MTGTIDPHFSSKWLSVCVRIFPESFGTEEFTHFLRVGALIVLHGIRFGAAARYKHVHRFPQLLVDATRGSERSIAYLDIR